MSEKRIYFVSYWEETILDVFTEPPGLPVILSDQEYNKFKEVMKKFWEVQEELDSLFNENAKKYREVEQKE